MKPCSSNRKRIALLALDALEPRHAGQLRAHLETCDGCRQYLVELSSVSETLSSARRATDAQAPAAFQHQKLTAALRAAGPQSRWTTFQFKIRDAALDWQIALPALGAIAVLLLVLSLILRHPAVPLITPQIVSVGPTPTVASITPTLNPDLAPSVANYLLVANRSLDQFDDLLTKQANRHPLTAPVYTPSMLARANGSD